MVVRSVPLKLEAKVDIDLHWLNNCNSIKSLSFDPRYILKYNIRNAKRRGYYPISWNILKLENTYLYRLLNSSNPDHLRLLPKNGIYLFYEDKEKSDHGDGILKPRIVRIGTHKENNFRTRISEHFLLNESKMRFTLTNPKPSDRSIFRKNIGRALLIKQGDSDYLKLWNIDYTSRINRTNYSQLRNIDKEKSIESQITGLLRKSFYFRFIPLERQGKRMGKKEMESRLIGTVANCKLCNPSKNWLGRYSPISKINSGKLWLSQHIASIGFNKKDQIDILEAIVRQ